MLYVFGYDINWWKGESCWLLMCLQNQKKKKRDTKVSYIVKKRKEKYKTKACIIKLVVAKIRMKEDGPKRCRIPKLCTLLVF